MYYPSSSIVLRLLFSSLSNDWSFLNRSASISVGILLKLFLDFRELERLEFEEPVEINIEELEFWRIIIENGLYLDLQTQIRQRLISEEANVRRIHQSLHGGKLFRHLATGMRRTKSFLSLVSITQRKRSAEKTHWDHWRERECERRRNVWSSAKSKTNIVFHDQ